MAGHSKFKNIMHRKGAQDAKRAKKFTKLIREITTAARMGEPDPNFNSRLRAAISTARAENLPKDRIDNAIKKGSSSQEGDSFVEIKYECYAFAGAAMVIDCLTDNRNRSASDIKSIINKAGATVAEPGSVLFMFDRVGRIIFINKNIDEEKLLELSLEAGAEECESHDDTHVVYTSVESFNDVRDFFENKLGQLEESKITWKAKDTIEVSDMEIAEKLIKLFDNLEDNDDVQQVSMNYEFSEDIANKLEI